MVHGDPQEVPRGSAGGPRGLGDPLEVLFHHVGPFRGPGQILSPASKRQNPQQIINNAVKIFTFGPRTIIFELHTLDPRGYPGDPCGIRGDEAPTIASAEFLVYIHGHVPVETVEKT